MDSMTSDHFHISQPEDEIHLLDLITTLVRRRTVFAAAFLAVFIGVALYTFLMKPVYEASSSLHVKEVKGQGTFLGELSLSATNPVNAEIEILKSRSNAEQVVKRLHLDWRVDKKADGLSFRILEFSSAAEKPVYRVQLTGPDAFRVEDEGGTLIGSGTAGMLMQAPGFTLLLKDLKGQKGDSFRLTLVPFDDAVAALQRNIAAKEQGRATGIIRVSYAGTDPVLARDIVNTLVQAYLEQGVAFKSEEASRAVGFVEEQLQNLRGELDAAEKNLETYKSSTGVVKLDSEAHALIDRISEVEKAQAAINIQRKQIGFALASLNEAVRKGMVYSPAVMRDDPLVTELARKLADLQTQKTALLVDYTPAHPGVKSLQGQIDEVQAKIRATYETALANLAKQQESAAQELEAYERRMRNLPTAERDLARLTRVSKVSSDIYTFLLQKHEEARIARASTISNIDVVDPAIAPNRPIKPRKALNLLLGLMVGVILGAALAFLQEYMDDTIKDSDQAKRVTGLPLLAVIPHIPTPRTKRNGDGSARGPDAGTLFTIREPKSVVAESFRSLRTSLHFSAINREKKIMLVTSTFPGEGKSIISANLAHIISQTGARVLILDCDLRRSSLHEKFGQSKAPGLSEILTGDIAFQEARHDLGVQNLDLITAGTTPPNPSELLGSEAMRSFLLARKEEYDHILIDAPPVLAVTDAPVLTSVVDVVILVMEAGRVPIKTAQHLRETLATLQAPVAGIVMNDKTGKGERYGYYGGRYYRYGYKRYGYGHGYGYYSDDEPKSRLKASSWKRLLSFWKKK